MEIPNNATVWIVLGVLAAAVIGLALWRHYNVVVRKGDTEVRFERQPEGGADRRVEDEAGRVSVLNKATLKQVEAGDITGVATSGGAAVSPTDVGRGAVIQNSKLGNITGVAQGAPPRTDKPSS